MIGVLGFDRVQCIAYTREWLTRVHLTVAAHLDAQEILNIEQEPLAAKRGETPQVRTELSVRHLNAVCPRVRLRPERSRRVDRVVDAKGHVQAPGDRLCVLRIRETTLEGDHTRRLRPSRARRQGSDENR